MVQGVEAKEDVLVQDNESRIVIHKNHLFRASKGIKHANVRHFFVAEKI